MAWAMGVTCPYDGSYLDGEIYLGQSCPKCEFKVKPRPKPRGTKKTVDPHAKPVG